MQTAAAFTATTQVFSVPSSFSMALTDVIFVYLPVWVAGTALCMGRWSFLTFSGSIAILYCVHHIYDRLCVVVQRYAILSLRLLGCA